MAWHKVRHKMEPIYQDCVSGSFRAEQCGKNFELWKSVRTCAQRKNLKPHTLRPFERRRRVGNPTVQIKRCVTRPRSVFTGFIRELRALSQLGTKLTVPELNRTF